MKKIIYIALFLKFFTGGSFASDISWGSADLSSYGFSDGWLVALYEDVDKDGWNATSINFTTGATDSDDVFLGITTSISAGKSTFWGSTFTSPSGDLSLGDSVVSIIFNSSALDGSANLAWYSSEFTGLTEVGDGGALLPSTDVPATYQTTAVTQVVPEPTTFFLFALGGMGAWIIRRKNRLATEKK